MTDDTPIFDVIASYPRFPKSTHQDIFAALRDAGYDVVPADTANLGRVVQSLMATYPQSVFSFNTIYAEAGVERP